MTVCIIAKGAFEKQCTPLECTFSSWNNYQGRSIEHSVIWQTGEGTTSKRCVYVQFVWAIGARSEARFSREVAREA
jgi:hypothetical protein